MTDAATMTCSSATAVMRRLDSENQLAERSVTFISSYDDTGIIYRTVILDFDEWLSMGEPEAITITIEPGDKLNGEGTTPVEVTLDGDPEN